MTEPCNSGWTISPQSARFACALSTLPFIINICAIAFAGVLVSRAVINPSLPSILLGLVGVTTVVVAIHLTTRVSLTLSEGTLHAQNRMTSHTVALTDIEKLAVVNLDRDPKSPPCIYLKVASRKRLIPLKATAAWSDEERQRIADRFSAIGLKPSQRYVKW